MNEIQLGFGPVPLPEYVFINASNSPKTGWHLWNFDTELAVPIEQPALTGYITGIETFTRESEEHGPSEKLQIHINAGPKNYIIRTGSRTAFVRSLLAALITVPPDHKSHPFSIATEIGKKKTVFATVYDAVSGTKLEAEYLGDDSALRDAIDTVKALFGAPKVVTTDFDDHAGADEADNETPEPRKAAAASNGRGQKSAEPKGRSSRSEPSQPAASQHTSQIPGLEQTRENKEAILGFIRDAGQKTPDDKMAEIGGRQVKVKSHVLGQWNAIKDDWSQLLIAAQHLEQASGLTFSLPAAAR